MRRSLPIFISLSIIWCFISNSCHSDSIKDSTNKIDLPCKEVNRYIPTVLPMHLDHLSDAQKIYIAESHRTDTSSYLIDTRPVLFQIVHAGNGLNKVKETQKINRDLDVLIYSLGEINNGELVDYGWIENSFGHKIWEMSKENSCYAGGDSRNIKSVFRLLLLKDNKYSLHYVSNESHDFDCWIGIPPENPENYGITVFNMEVIERLSEYFRFQHVIDRNSYE